MSESDSVKLSGRMPPWSKAQAVYSWWGAVVPTPWRLVVVNPAVPQSKTNDLVADLHHDGIDDPTTAARLTNALVGTVALLVVVLLLVLGNAAFHEAEGGVGLPSVLLGVVVCTVLAPILMLAISQWNRCLAPRRGLPAEMRVRTTPVEADLWALIRHLNSYRTADAETSAAVRQLLWALAHTDDRTEHQVLMQDLANTLTGWTERGAATLHNAAARVWTAIPAGTTNTTA